MSSYNRVAGQSVERLAALSDGIFGVAMTLLLLGLPIPDKNKFETEQELAHYLLSICPDLVVYLMSFLTLGIFWVGQQTQLNYLDRSDRHLTWIHLAVLFAVTLVPFSTRTLANYIAMRTALLIYWGNICLLGALLYASWGYATRAKLVKHELTKEIKDAICRRIVYAQGWYVLGASLCAINTHLSIGFIVLTQLNYAVAPQMWRRK